MQAMDDDQRESPLRVTKASRERVRLDVESLFSNRRWVINANGKVVERYGPALAGDKDVVRTLLP